MMRHKRLKHGENDEEDEDVDMEEDSPAHSDAENKKRKTTWSLARWLKKPVNILLTSGRRSMTNT
jgi:hypothetical protein